MIVCCQKCKNPLNVKVLNDQVYLWCPKCRKKYPLKIIPPETVGLKGEEK